MYLEVTGLLPLDAASHYEAIRTILFARTLRCGGGEDRRRGTEITIKGLCVRPTAELFSFGGGPWGAPGGPVALDPRSSDLTRDNA